MPSRRRNGCRWPLADVFRRGAEFPGLPPGSVASAQQFLGMLESLRPPVPGPQLVELIRRLLRDVRYGDEIVRCYPDDKTRTERWDAINEIMNMAEIHVRQNRQATLAGFLDDLALSAAEDRTEEAETRADRVTLMTLHSAKGLEFGEVYLVGMEEGLLPHAKSVQEGFVEEERRLAYVGITRARRRLTLTYTLSRARYGQRAPVVPSRFLYELRGMKPPQHEQPLPAQASSLAKRPRRGQHAGATAPSMRPA